MRADSELASSSSSTSSKDVLAATPGGPAAGPSPSSRDAAMMRSFRLLMNASSAAAFSSAAPSPPGRQRLGRGWRQARSLGLLGSAMHPVALRFLCGAPLRSAPAHAVAPRDARPTGGAVETLHGRPAPCAQCSKQALISADPLARIFPHSTAQKSAHNASPLPCGSAVCRTPHRACCIWTQRVAGARTSLHGLALRRRQPPGPAAARGPVLKRQAVEELPHVFAERGVHAQRAASPALPVQPGARA